MLFSLRHRHHVECQEAARLGLKRVKVLVFVLRRRRFQGLQEGGRGGNDVSLYRMETEDTQKRRDLKRDVKSGVDRVSCLVAGLQLIATLCRGPAPTGEHLDVDDK
jgi:hypothetical protein